MMMHEVVSAMPDPVFFSGTGKFAGAIHKDTGKFVEYSRENKRFAGECVPVFFSLEHFGTSRKENR